MANRFKTVYKAKEEIIKLENYVKLVENAPEETLKQIIIKYYAYLGSLAKVAAKVNELGHSIDGHPYIGSDISVVIKEAGNDPLHKFIRTEFLSKTRHIRKRAKEYPFKITTNSKNCLN